jgi:hypothetical protein
MTTTWKFIGKIQLNSSAGSINFTSIPQTYSDLVMIGSPRSDVSGQGDGVRLTINGADTLSNSARRNTAYNNGSTASLGSNTDRNIIFCSGNAWTANSFGAFMLWIPDYASTRSKVAIARTMWGGPNITTGTGFLTGLNSVTAGSSAITQLGLAHFDSGGSNFLTGSQFFLYGIETA